MPRKTESKLWEVKNVLLYSEILVSYAVESTKMYADLPLFTGYTIRFSEPFVSSKSTISMLYLVSAFALFLGWIVDSFIGKYVVALFSIFLALLSSTFCLLSVSYEPHKEYFIVLSKRLMMIYISSSTIRNIFVLEQFRKDEEELRRYLFYLIYIRILARSSCKFLSAYSLDNQFYMSILSILSLLAYLFILLYFIKKIHVEATYFMIWEYCLKCILVSLTRKTYQSFSTFRLGGRGIIKAVQQKKNVGFKSEVEMMNSLMPLGKKFGMTGVVEEQLPVEKKPQNTIMKKTMGFMFPMSASLIFSDMSRMDQEQDVLRNLVLFLAFPAVSKFVVYQTMCLVDSLKFMMLGIFMGNIMCFLTMTITTQWMFSLKSKSKFLEGFSVTTFSLIFDVLLFPIFEFLVYPLIKKRKKLHISLLGYFILIVTLSFSIIVQFRLEETFEYLPEPYTSQLRLFNSLPFPIVTSAGYETNTIQPFGHVFINRLYAYKKTRISIEIDSVRSYQVLLTEKKAVTCIINERGLIQNSETDPTLFPASGINSELCYFFVIHGFLSIRKKFVLYDKTNNKYYRFYFDKQINEIDPGEYRLLGKTKGNFTLKSSTLYAFFFYVENQVLKTKLTILEGPFPYLKPYLIAQIFLTSLVNAFASISYFIFLYQESARKLRGGTFSLFFVLQFLTVAFLESYTHFTSSFYYSRLIIFYTCVYIIAFIFTAYYIITYDQNKPII